MSKKIELGGDFTSPYVEASARSVQTAEKEKAMTQEFYPMNGEQWVTAGKVASLEKRIAELTAELEVTDKLLNEQSRVMDAIPECPVHGQRCIPHAVDWIDSIRTERAELRRSNAELAAEKEEMLKLLYGRDLEIERLAEALGKCSQAREAALGK